jgi:hypothetical protein
MSPAKVLQALGSLIGISTYCQMNDLHCQNPRSTSANKKPRICGAF